VTSGLWVHTISYGEAAVAFGTLALAGITGYLGIETRATARAARQAVEASEEPFVIATPIDSVEAMTLRNHEQQAMVSLPPTRPPFQIHRAEEDGGGGRGFVRLRLWNIGLGPTIVENLSLYRGGESFLSDLPQFYTLAVGTIADVEVPVRRWRDPCAATLAINYTHADGREYLTNSAVTIRGNIVSCVTYERTRPPKRATRLRRVGHWSWEWRDSQGLPPPWLLRVARWSGDWRDSKRPGTG
jgi:hypothetical protein